MKYAVLLLLLTGCSSDSFDPMIGPRNPEPGAARYFATCSGIAQSDKDSLLEQQACPLPVLQDLAVSPSKEVRALVATNPSADAAVLEKLSSDPDPGVRQYAGTNPNISRKTLQKLAADPDSTVHASVARNPKWTADEIRRMHREKTAPSSVIARNPSTPPDVLKELSYGSDYNVLCGLAGNPSIPPYVINRLANDSDSSIRLILANNEAIPTSTLEKLAKDPHADVKRSAMEQLELRHKRR